jgi:plastocyanin
MVDTVTDAQPSRAPGAAAPAGGGGTTRPARGVRPIWFVLAASLLVAGAVVTIALLARGGDRPPQTFEYTVPEGTGARIAAGEQVFVFPARLDLHVGDTVVIHNDDTRPAVVGPYTVDRNATLSQTFYRPGWVTGFCSIHPSGRVTIHIVS